MTDEKVEIVFTSDSTEKSRGFVIEWKFIEGSMNYVFKMFTLKSYVFT